MNTQNQSYGHDEKGLTELAAKGDLEAFNQLVLMHKDMAYSHVFSLLGDSDSAEDAVQEGFVKAFQSIGSFRGGSFRSWLLKIITNSAYDMLRRSRRRPTQPLFPDDENGEEIESPPWLADPAASIQSTVEQNELSRQIYETLDSLPSVYRNVLTLIDLYDLDYAEAAQALKVPIGTVKSRLARARFRMKEQLQGVAEYSSSSNLVTARRSAFDIL